MGKLLKRSLIKSVIAFISIALLCCSGCAAKSSNISPKKNAGIKATPESYDAFEGKYWHTPYSITVSKDGDTLYVQKKGEKKYELYPESGDTFSYKGVNARITFNRDGEGKVKSLSLFQHGNEMLAKKIDK